MRISVTSALYGGENIAVASFKFPLMRANFCAGGFCLPGQELGLLPTTAGLCNREAR